MVRNQDREVYLALVWCPVLVIEVTGMNYENWRPGPTQMEKWFLLVTVALFVTKPGTKGSS
jgi:hypothetical protein